MTERVRWWWGTSPVMSEVREQSNKDVAIRRGEGAQRKRCRDPRCSPRGIPACRGTFGGRRKAVRVWKRPCRATSPGWILERGPPAWHSQGRSASPSKGSATVAFPEPRGEARAPRPKERAQWTCFHTASPQPVVATREESGVLGFPSRRGLTPRGRQRPRESFFNASRGPSPLP